MQIIKAPAPVVLALSFFSSSAIAGTAIWDGGTAGTGTSMATAANWAGDALPASGDDWIIATATGNATVGGASGSNISISANRTVGNLTFGGTSAAGTTLPSSLSITTNGSGTTARTLTINTGIVMTDFATGTVVFPGNTFGNLTVDLGATGTRTFQVGNATGSLSFVTAQAITGGAGIIKTGAGTLGTGGNNTFSGGSTLSAGTWRTQLSSAASGGAITSGPFGTGTLTLLNGTVRSATTSARTYHNSVNLGGNITLGDLTSNGNQTFSTAAGGATTLTANSTLNVVTTTTWDQAIGGAAKLTKTGAGDLYLTSSNNTFSGGLVIAQGTLIVDFTAGLGPANVANDSAVVINGGTLRYTNNTTSSSDANRGFRVGSSGGTIDLVDSAKTLTITGVVQNVSGETGTLTKTGLGTLRLSGDNSYSGTTLVSSGTLLIANTTGSGTGTGAVTVSSGATLGGNGTVGGNVTLNSATIGTAGNTLSLSSTLTTTGASNVAAASTVNVAGTTTLTSGSLTINGNLGVNGTLGGSGTVTVASGGSLSGNATLSGATTISSGGTLGTTGNTIALSSTLAVTGTNSIATGAIINVTGNTTISSGVFSVNGTLGGSGGKFVTSGATLGGTGTILGVTTIGNSGTLAPGNSPGLLTFTGDLTLNHVDANAVFEINGTGRGTGYDAVDVSGALTYNGDLTVNFGYSPTVPPAVAYDLFDFSTKSGNFDTITIAGTYAASLSRIGDIWSGTDIVNSRSFSFDQTSGALTVAAIPEPAALTVLAGFGVIGIALYRRRRTAR